MLGQFYEKVSDEVAAASNGAGADVLGPGLARKEFEHAIDANHPLRGRIRRNEAVDANLTEKQVIAKVRELLGQPPERVKLQ